MSQILRCLSFDRTHQILSLHPDHSPISNPDPTFPFNTCPCPVSTHPVPPACWDCPPRPHWARWHSLPWHTCWDSVPDCHSDHMSNTAAFLPKTNGASSRGNDPGHVPSPLRGQLLCLRTKQKYEGKKGNPLKLALQVFFNQYFYLNNRNLGKSIFKTFNSVLFFYYKIHYKIVFTKLS